MAEKGQYLRIARVDSRGRVVALEGAEAVSGGTSGPVTEPEEADIPRVFFGSALPQTKNETVMSFRYISRTKDITGYCKIKAQGNSSMSYPKKNQTVKLYKDADCTEKLKVNFKDWGEQNKFCFKANWIDLTHARNVVSARLWGDVVKSRANYDTIPEGLRTSPNQGAVDGFPVKVYADGIYQGRYTLNIPKDAWMANMDEELDTHCILCGENYVSGCFRAEANIDGSDWTDEIHDTVPDSIKTRWNEAIRFVMNSTDEEFAAGIGAYFDVESLVDYYIFGMVSCGLDAFGKNQLYMTYDGQKWYAQMYDMDSTWGLYWNGSQLVSHDYGRNAFEDFAGRQGNLLFIRLAELFKEQIEQRWNILKQGALSIDNLVNRFERFTDIAPPYLVEEDYAATTAEGAFTAIPLSGENNIQQLREFIRKRCAWFTESFTMGQVLYSNYSPGGATFYTETAINWDTQYFEASVDLSTNPSGNAARILLSVGQDVSLWNGGKPVMHIYYMRDSNAVRVQFFNDYNQYGTQDVALEDTKLLIRLDKDGAYLNGTLLTADSYGSVRKQYYLDALEDLTALETVQVGAVEGANKSYTTYEYISVKNM